MRDNTHRVDVARFIHEFADGPRSGEVYNIGGGKANSCSILEALALVHQVSGLRRRYYYFETKRIGDHICH